MTEPTTEFSTQIENLSKKILKTLSASSQDNPATAWDLKMEFLVPLSHLYMALGILLDSKKISIAPEGLSYRIRTVKEKENEPVAVEPALENAVVSQNLSNTTESRTTNAARAKAALGVRALLEANALPNGES